MKLIKWDDATFDRIESYKRGDGMQRMQPQPARSKEAQNNDADGFGPPGTRLLWRVISKNEPYSGLESFRNGFCDHKIYDEDHQFGNNIKLTGLQVP